MASRGALGRLGTFGHVRRREGRERGNGGRTWRKEADRAESERRHVEGMQGTRLECVESAQPDEALQLVDGATGQPGQGRAGVSGEMRHIESPKTRGAGKSIGREGE